MPFEVKVLKGQESLRHNDAIMAIRLAAFFEFPYLFVATSEDEQSCTKKLSENPESLVVAVFKGDEMIGFFSGIPLRTENYTKELHKEGIDIESTYYGWELIIKPNFQKQRWCGVLIKRFLEEVKMMGFTQLLFMTLVHEEDHPLRPAKYVPPDSIWIKSGAKKTAITLSIPWNTRQLNGPPKDQFNSLVCWIKELPKQAI